MEPDRRDLAATLAPLWRSLLGMEREVSARHGLSMWGYATLHELAGTPVRSQVALAGTLGIDKTRLIPVLDELQDRALIRREPDPDDRRVRLLFITPAGRRLFRRVQRVVHAEEDELLSPLTAAQREAFVAAASALGSLRRG